MPLNLKCLSTRVYTECIHTNIGRQLGDIRWEIETLWWAEQEEGIYITKWRLTFARVFSTKTCNPGIYIGSYNLTDSKTLIFTDPFPWMNIENVIEHWTRLSNPWLSWTNMSKRKCIYMSRSTYCSINVLFFCLIWNGY